MKILFQIITIYFLLISFSQADSIIRDAEIENELLKIAQPIFDAAGLKNESITLYIVNNKEINAYVSGGSNIFIHTGLLGLSLTPDILRGVLAHETGHISGGHLLKNSEEYKNTSIKATLGYMVGLAAAAAGSPQAGVVIAQGTGHIASRQLLKHTRTHEEAADQAALEYLDSINKSATGLLELLELLYSNENQLYENLNPYALTHPLSRQRIGHVANHIDNSKIHLISPTAQEIDSFSRAITKLNAFLSPSEETLSKYPQSNLSINAHYARAIAYYKIPNIENAINEIDALLIIEPNNPFFNELKGQILFENGKVTESIIYYVKANKYLPNSPLLKIILATAQIASQNESMRISAISNLEEALLLEKENSFAWRQLAIAYGRGNNLGMSNLALAEEAFLLDDKKMVRKFIELADKDLKDGSPAKLRTKDLLDTINKK